MLTTEQDLIRWEKEKNTDKFLQILEFLDGDDFSYLRLRAIEFFGQLRDESYIPVIMRELARTPEFEDRIAEILVSWGESTAHLLAHYAVASEDDDEPRYYAVRLINRFCESVSLKIYLKILNYGFWKKAISKILCESGMTEKFLVLLEMDDPNHQIVALDVIRYSPVTKYVMEILFKTTGLEDVQVREYAYEIVNRFVYESGEDRYEGVGRGEFLACAVETARVGLNDEEPLIRCSSLRIIGSLEDGSSSPRVIELLNDEWQNVREQAVACLTCIPHKGTSQLLTQIYLDKDADEDYRQNAVIALGTCLDAGSEEILRGVVRNDDSDYFKYLAVDGLLFSRPNTTQQFLLETLLHYPKLYFCLKNCRRRTYNVSESLFDLLRQQKERLGIRAVIWMLGQLGRDEDVLHLCRLVADSDENLDIVAYAVMRILNWGGNDPIDFFLEHKNHQGKGVDKIRKILEERIDIPAHKWEDPIINDLGLS